MIKSDREVNDISGPSFNQKELAARPRDYSLDHIRFFLIFTVVFGHLIEVVSPFPGSKLLYSVIYAFHMPAFLFLFGYLIKYSGKRIIFRFVIPYLVFQIVYLFFCKYLLKQETSFQFHTPYWLLWYMLVCIYYQMLIPLFEIIRKKHPLILLFSSFAIALLVGFFPFIGYFLSLSRFFVFLPWFLLGYLCQKAPILEKIALFAKKHPLFHILSTLSVCLSILLLYLYPIPKKLLYGSYAYTLAHGTLLMRMISMLIALAWIAFLFITVKQYVGKKLFLITTIGQNTLPIFIFHGLTVKAFPLIFPFEIHSALPLLLFSAVLCLLFGNRLCKKLLDYVGFYWLEALISKQK